MGQLIAHKDLENLIGYSGVDNLTDDGTEDVLLDMVIEQAEGWIFSRLSFKHSAPVLAKSPVVKQTATYMAAYYLSERRGNPFHYREQMEDLKEEIEEYRVSKAELTDELGNQLPQDNLKDYVISMQNMVVDERHAYNRIRTVGETSVQTENENLFERDGFRGLFGT
jgi:hypothetical protein